MQSCLVFGETVHPNNRDVNLLRTTGNYSGLLRLRIFDFSTAVAELPSSMSFFLSSSFVL
jgi:hypothetical protein